MSDALRPRVGEGRLIKDVPSFEDAFDPKKQVMLWNDGSEMIVLSLAAYPTRASLGVRRVSRSSWLEEMGADQGEFWDKTLKATGLATSLPTIDPSTQSQTTPTSKPPPVVQPPATKKSPEAKPAPTPTEEPASSTPWSVIIVLIVAATGLLCLLLKKRK
jgi:cell division septation protein DedD